MIARGAGAAGSPSSRRDRAAEQDGRLLGELVLVLGGDAAPVLLRSAPSGGSAAVRAAVGLDVGVLGASRRRLDPTLARPPRRPRRWTSSSRYAGTLASSSWWRADVRDRAVLQQRHLVGEQHGRRAGARPRCRWRRASTRRSASSTSASVCDVERGQRCRRAPGSRGRRGRPGPARAAAADRRTGTCPARRSGSPAPTAGRGRTRPGRSRAPRAIVLLGGVGPAEREVLPDAHREQRRLLEGGGDDRAAAQGRVRSRTSCPSMRDPARR